MQKPERLILFDIDGTLLKTDGAGRRATRLAMEEVFGTASFLDQHNFSGKPDWQTLYELLKDDGYTVESIGEAMPTFEQAMGKHMSAIMPEHTTTVCTGAMETVKSLRDDARYLIGIVTGNTTASAKVKLISGGFEPDWFPIGAFGSESIDRNNLPPLALQRAINYTQYDIQPHEVIIIGDTVMDITCARALGAIAVAVTTGYTKREDLVANNPDYLLDDLTGFSSIL